MNLTDAYLLFKEKTQKSAKLERDTVKITKQPADGRTFLKGTPLVKD